LSFHLYVGLPNGLFPPDFPVKILCVFPISHPSHPPDLIILPISRRDPKYANVINPPCYFLPVRPNYCSHTRSVYIEFEVFVDRDSMLHRNIDTHLPDGVSTPKNITIWTLSLFSCHSINWMIVWIRVEFTEIQIRSNLKWRPFVTFIRLGLTFLSMFCLNSIRNYDEYTHNHGTVRR
jgi:hypothetical protein